MQYVITLNFLLSLMAAGVLYLVWRRDTTQPFTRDFALVLLFSCLAGTFLALFQFGPVQYKSIFLWANIAAGAAIQVRLYAALWHLGHPQISARLLWRMYLGFLCAFMALSYGGTMQRVGPVASALEMVFGVYCIRAYWASGWAERAIGFGTIGTGFTLVFVESSVADWAMVAMGFQQVCVAFAFVYAAMDRSAARTEHQRERFERLSANSMQGIVVLHGDHIVYANAAAVAIYGYASEAELIAGGIWTLARPGVQARFQHASQHLLAVGASVIDVQGEFHRRDGAPIYLNMTGWPTTWDGLSVIQLLITDDTQKRAAAEELERVREQQQRDRAAAAELVQREKLAALGRMVSGIAHELNTPIGIALTAGSYLRGQVVQTQTQLDTGQLKASVLKEFLLDSQEGAQVLEKSLLQAERLLSSFRLVAQDHSQEGCVPFSVSALMLEIETLVRPGLDNTDIALHFDVVPGIEMHSFPGHVSQVVAQLIDNAKVHAFATGASGRIGVDVRCDADIIEIAVSDNGRGIAPELLTHIFDPFFTTRMGRSQGLGLNAVHTMVTRKLNGSIGVTSSANEGTRFVVRMPCSLTNTPFEAIA